MLVSELEVAMDEQVRLRDAELTAPAWRSGAGTRRIAVADPDEDVVTLAWRAGRTLLDRTTAPAPDVLVLAADGAPDGAASTLRTALRLDIDARQIGDVEDGLRLATSLTRTRTDARPVLAVLAAHRIDAGGRPLGSAALALLLTPDDGVVLDAPGSGGPSGPAAGYLAGDPARVVRPNPAFSKWLGAARTVPGLGDLGSLGPLVERLTMAGALRPVPDGSGPPPRLSPTPERFAPYYSAPQHWREGPDELALTGMRCDLCDAPEFPPAPACPQHGAVTPLRPVPLALTGTVFTRTRDHVFPVGGPLSMAVVDLDDGARFYGQVVPGHDVTIGDRVRLELRRMPTAAGASPRYFYKIAPEAQTHAG